MACEKTNLVNLIKSSEFPTNMVNCLKKIQTPR